MTPERWAQIEDWREVQALHGASPPTVAMPGRAVLPEIVDGEMLADKLQRETGAASRGLPLDEALVIARQLAVALEAAHEEGIVHRNLTPANIRITPDGIVKVLDFGLTKSIDGESSPDLTQVPSTHDGNGGADGGVIGAAAYMSPEQARGARVDSRTDIWSFGCVLYEMLSGRPAFKRATAPDTIAKILEREPDWSALPSDTPAAIRRILLRCLTNDARRRVRDFGDVRIEIDAIGEVLPGIPVSTVEEEGAAGREWWVPWVALTALVAAIAMLEFRRPASMADPLVDARFSQLTNWEGTEASAALSKDGKFVAFLSDRAGEFDVWAGEIGTGTFHNLTANVSPLNRPGIIRSLGFTAEGEVWFSLPDPTATPGRKLVVPVKGGSGRPLLSGPFASPSWSSDGKRLVYFINDPGDPLFIADGTGADSVPLVAADAAWPHNHYPVWSTDDQWIYFTRGSVYGLNDTDEMDVWRIRPGAAAPERITAVKTAITFIAPLDRRTLLYVGRSEDRSGPWLWTLDTQTKVRHRVIPGLERYTSVASSQDGLRVVASVARPVTRLWTLPLDRVALEGDVKPYDVPTSSGGAPGFAGEALFYLSSTAAGEVLSRLKGTVSDNIWKGSEGALSEAPAVSRDGQRVALLVRREGKQHLSIMAADGTDRRAVETSIAIHGTVDWSPDGAWIVVGGTDSRGPGLFKIPVDGGEPARLKAENATGPAWSPDGDLIVYGGQLVAGQVPLKAVQPDGTSVPLPEIMAHPGGYRFMPEGKTLVYLPRPRTLDFWMIDLAGGAPRQITRLQDRGRLSTFDITPDGKQLVFDRTLENSDIVLIERPRK